MLHHQHRQIEKLKKMILSLGAVVEEGVERAIRSFETRDAPLARRVIEGDNEVDELEIDVEEECLHTLALYQPVALDLRYVVSVLKINNDLERIADLGVNIAEQTLLTCQLPRLESIPFNLQEEARKVRAMLKQSLDAMVNQDLDQAETVRAADDQVDLVHRQMYQHVMNAIQKSPETVRALICLLNVSRYLERIADHAVNIAEDVIYMTKGDILRHSRTHTIAKDPL